MINTRHLQSETVRVIEVKQTDSYHDVQSCSPLVHLHLVTYLQ